MDELQRFVVLDADNQVKASAGTLKAAQAVAGVRFPQGASICDTAPRLRKGRTVPIVWRFDGRGWTATHRMAKPDA